MASASTRNIPGLFTEPPLVHLDDRAGFDAGNVPASGGSDRPIRELKRMGAARGDGVTDHHHPFTHRHRQVQCAGVPAEDKGEKFISPPVTSIGTPAETGKPE